jgi:hypothetical protein
MLLAGVASRSFRKSRGCELGQVVFFLLKDRI